MLQRGSALHPSYDQIDAGTGIPTFIDPFTKPVPRFFFVGKCLITNSISTFYRSV